MRRGCVSICEFAFVVAEHNRAPLFPARVAKPPETRTVDAKMQILQLILLHERACLEQSRPQMQLKKFLSASRANAIEHKECTWDVRGARFFVHHVRETEG